MNIEREVLKLKEHIVSKGLGEEEVAIAALILLKKIVDSSNAKTPHYLFHAIQAAKNSLLNLQKNNAVLHNALHEVVEGLQIQDSKLLRSLVDNKILKTAYNIKEANRRIIINGASKIKNGMNVFVMGYSRLLFEILRNAKSKGINFEVYTTENRPLLQGRRMALALSQAGFKVQHSVDSSANHLIKKADLVLFTALAITEDESIIAPLGTQLCAEFGRKYDAITYCVASSRHISKQGMFSGNNLLVKSKEIWDGHPQNILIHNNAFETVENRYVEGIISEFGVQQLSEFIRDSKKN